MMKHILIIDSDSLLTDDLLSVRCCIKTVDNGLEGIRLLNKEKFDMVIIELFSLGFDGKEVAKHVSLMRKNGGPIVVGLTDMPHLVKNNEFDRIIESPVSIYDLNELINYCIGKSFIDMTMEGPFCPPENRSFRS